MGLPEQIYERARENPQRIASPEAVNEKMMQTAHETGREEYIIPVLMGYTSETGEVLSSKGYEEDIFTVVDIREEIYKEKLIDRHVAPPYTSLKGKALNRHMQDPLYYVMAMEAVGEADVTFAGIGNTTGDTLLTGQVIIGLKPGTNTTPGIGLCGIPGSKGSEGSLLTIGGSAVCANPDSGQLAGITVSACDIVRNLLGQKPKYAMVSYFTPESGQGELVDKVTEAIRIANERRLEFVIDGELQFDAAISPAVTAKEVRRENQAAGKANVITWPGLNVGNVGIKLIQQFGHTDAYDPMFQGFNKVMCDCSGSVSVPETKGNIVISAVGAAGSKR